MPDINSRKELYYHAASPMSMQGPRQSRNLSEAPWCWMENIEFLAGEGSSVRVYHH